MIIFKAIKPKKLNIKEIEKALLAEAESIANDIELDFALTVGTWKRDVEFEKLVASTRLGIEILVDTDDEIYRYVNEGTKPHVILPKRAKALAFKSGYKAKTIVGKKVARTGGSFGSTVFSKGVIHPGTEARDFDEIIAKEWNKKFKRRMEKAMKKARNASDNPI